MDCGQTIPCGSGKIFLSGWEGELVRVSNATHTSSEMVVSETIARVVVTPGPCTHVEEDVKKLLDKMPSVIDSRCDLWHFEFSIKAKGTIRDIEKFLKSARRKFLKAERAAEKEHYERWHGPCCPICNEEWDYCHCGDGTPEDAGEVDHGPFARD